MLLADAWTASRWIVLSGVLTLILTFAVAQSMIIWLLPIAGPMAVAPLLIWATSLSAERGAWQYLFMTPTEIEPTAVMVARGRILNEWARIEMPLPELGPEPATAEEIGAGA